jgi:hypothetical protein
VVFPLLDCWISPSLNCSASLIIIVLIMIMQAFAAATLSAGDDPWIQAVGTGEVTYQSASFYQDSSGKSTMDVPLLIAFRDAASLNALLATKCLYPPPTSEDGEKNQSDTNQSDENAEKPASTVSLTLVW